MTARQWLREVVRLVQTVLVAVATLVALYDGLGLIAMWAGGQ